MSDTPLEINTQGTAAKILSETVAQKRFITVWHRKTQFNDGRVIDWDIVGHNTPYPTFVTVFTFDTDTKTTCILKEYAQGTNEISSSVSSTRTFGRGQVDWRRMDQSITRGPTRWNQ
ncbi:hypothetical protein PHYBLDRAFT_167703 [Phycomyces blakesleeanus NRRL 1555(-)]|uniref:Uncharacterized protein n=1 Tax=Phycomyces blakesleeanus (strain ATCC 8743b / DSM 1359 / FGSC 10004 / NBRC 33097 / NRRL 1555) TaxID=763407 RepID=A0A167MWL2_PHYB8|nr:hypothetical protein PHYBLDRAFT_167703 [Phycomyces blakesleeanus NRRL 1555(-)]OAD74284.1 hypothetical protein PHYBLDRAFT_167703 [Phycomyces blakesleeanus NRRL 1555(-)]|eukprot:XP_018292324.1 hypothetical protein PHYBLDRAFT_167703 [Phycomyces blakesleeanus NRRL 1555(-)]